MYDHFSSPSSAGKLVSLSHFEKYKDATEALTSVTSLIEGKMSKKLKKTLKKIVDEEGGEEKVMLAVADSKLGQTIKEKFNLDCMATDAVQKLMSCIRSQLPSLVPDWNADEEAAMQLAISHGYVADYFIC